jgi:AraC-like DNA-binding protein
MIPNEAIGTGEPAPRAVEAIEWLSLLKSENAKIDVRVGGLSPHLRLGHGWRTAPARLPEHLLVGVKKGGLAGWAGGEPFLLGPGCLAWICPGVLFDFRATGKGRTDLVRARISLSSAKTGERFTLPWPLWAGGVGDRVLGYIEHLAGYDEDLGPDLFGDVRVRSLASLVSIEVLGRDSPHAGGDARLSPLHRERLRELAFSPHLAGWRVRDIAGAVGLAPSYFRKVFHATYGISPKRWLMEERVREAARMLRETALPVGEIAAAVGYAKARDLSRAFREIFACPPAKFRKREPKGI